MGDFGSGGTSAQNPGGISEVTRGEILIRLARAALESELVDPGIWGPALVASGAGDEEASSEARARWLEEPGATFVTLRSGRQLRGCIGSLEATSPLVEDLRANAVAAALRDPRFEPLTASELPQIRLEVSLLGRQEKLDLVDEAAAHDILRPHIDGVVLRFRGRRATFLPQVWTQISSPALFLNRLKLKAGLPEDFWHPELEIERYPVEKWAEPEVYI